MRNKTKILSILSLLLIVFSCNDPWQNHLDEYNMNQASSDLLGIIQNTPDLSQFYQLIKDAGLEDEISSSQTTTIWAPSNSALSSMNADFSNQPDKLVEFVENQMARGIYPADPKQTPLRLKMMNGKRVMVDMANKMIDNKEVTGDFNHVATNGILHIVDQAIELKPNIWEYLEKDADQNLSEVSYLNSLTGTKFIDSLATQIGFDPVTSKPIYDTLSGTVWYNKFVNEHTDLRNEDSLFTFLLLDNTVFQQQYDRFRPYYKLSDNDPRDPDEFTRYQVCLDLVASGKWTPEELGGVITSVDGIQLPFSRSAIEQTIETSNGVIYKLSSCDLSLENKFPPIIIEGEDSTKVVFTGGGYTGYTRNKPLAHGGEDFVLDNHKASPGRIVYHAGMVAATKYNFYWQAVDDFGGSYYGAKPDSLIRQKLEKVIYLPKQPLETRFPVHRTISDSLLYVVDQSYQTAELRYAGSFTFSNYDDLWLQLVGSGNNTTLTLDYLKIVPVFE